MMRAATVATALFLAGSLISAQDEGTLRHAFEGKTVIVKIDMPGSSTGVNVHPSGSEPIDFRKVAKDLKQYGTGVHAGQSIMVTKVHIKGHHIEFQLGGGGFGTFADYAATANTASTVPYYEGKSRREKSLEHDLKYETNSQERREMKEELDDLRRERRHDNAWEASAATRANVDAEREMRQRRAEAGSRFNIRYDHQFPPGALTPDGTMDALAQYVDFGTSRPATGGAAASSPSGASATALKKGLTLRQVESLLGPAATATTESQGSIEIMTRTYSGEGQKIVAKFTSGILIEYAITSD